MQPCCVTTSVNKAGGNANRKKWCLFVGFAAVYAKKATNFELKRCACQNFDCTRLHPPPSPCQTVLLIFTARLLAERRKARGMNLNYPESLALNSAAVMKGARDGKTVAQLIS